MGIRKVPGSPDSHIWCNKINGWRNEFDSRRLQQLFGAFPIANLPEKLPAYIMARQLKSVNNNKNKSVVYLIIYLRQNICYMDITKMIESIKNRDIIQSRNSWLCDFRIYIEAPLSFPVPFKQQNHVSIYSVLDPIIAPASS